MSLLCSFHSYTYPTQTSLHLFLTGVPATQKLMILSQLNEDGRELSKSECQYCMIHQELLATGTISNVQQYHSYLKIKFQTDHNSLSWLSKFYEPEGRCARWLERLQEQNMVMGLQVVKLYTKMLMHSPSSSAVMIVMVPPPPPPLPLPPPPPQRLHSSYQDCMSVTVFVKCSWQIWS